MEISRAETGSSRTRISGSASAPGQWRCAGAGRRRTCVDSGHSVRAAVRRFHHGAGIFLALGLRVALVFTSRALREWSRSSGADSASRRDSERRFAPWRAARAVFRVKRRQSLPPMMSVPEVGGSIIVTMRARVDLPQPDSPTTARVLPRSRVKLAPSTAFRSQAP